MPSAIEIEGADKQSSKTDNRRDVVQSIHRLGEAAMMIAPDKQPAKVVTSTEAKQLVDLKEVAINDFPPEKSYSITVDSVPATIERRPYYPKQGDKLQDPGTARSNIAPSNESPHGTTQNNWAEDHKHQTVSLCITTIEPQVD